MNNMPPFFNGFGNNSINDLFNRIDMITQELKRLERRILNIEKNLVPTPYNKIKPIPMENISNNMNNNYTTDNYII